MKKIIIIAIAILSVVSCASYKGIPEEIDSFVDTAEIKAGKYTSSDWETSKQEYEALVDQYTENFDKFTDDQKALATNAMGRYHALLVKNGLAETAGVINMIKELLPEYINGLSDTINENKDEIVSTLSSILDFNDLGESLENLGEGLGTLFEDLFKSLDGTYGE